MQPGFDMRTQLRWAAFLYIAVLCCPVELFPIAAHVDASWQLGLNLAADQGLRFGEDILWPSGPYAYLDSPMPVGDNLAEGLAAQFALWLVAALAVADLVFLRKPEPRGLVALMAAFAVGVPLFHFNSQGSDSLLSLIALLLAASALMAPKWQARLTAAAAAAGLAGLLKLSAAAIGGSGVAVAAVLLWRRGTKDGLRATAIVAVVGPASFAAGYWLHNPTIRGFRAYLGSLKMFSEGYGGAMSIDGPAIQVYIALVVIAAFLALALHLLRTGQAAGGVAALFVLPLLLSFKHGFVRQDSHIASFFCFGALVLGVTLAYADWKRLSRPLAMLQFVPLLPLTILMSAWSASDWTGRPIQDPGAIYSRTLSGAASLKHVAAAFDLEHTQAELLARSREAHDNGAGPIPAALTELLDGKPVAVLSPYSTRAFLAGLDLRVVKVIQKYAAFTPALDGASADWLVHDGPANLLMQWQAIDGRHPMLETPRVWAAVWRSFDCIAAEGKWALLRRRATPRFDEPAETASLSPEAGGEIALPEHAGPLFVTLERSPTLEGRVMPALFRVPEMQLRLELANGESVEHRTFPGALESAIPVSPLPLGIDDLAAMLAPDAGPSAAPRVRAIEVGGKGESYFTTARVTLASPAVHRAERVASSRTAPPDEEPLEP